MTLMSTQININDRKENRHIMNMRLHLFGERARLACYHRQSRVETHQSNDQVLLLYDDDRACCNHLLLILQWRYYQSGVPPRTLSAEENYKLDDRQDNWKIRVITVYDNKREEIIIYVSTYDKQRAIKGGR